MCLLLTQNTVRMWTIAFVFTTIGSGINMLLSMRRPTVGISALVAQLLAYPVGKAWEKFMPNWKLQFFGRSIHLNPTPFNIKEHALIVVHLNSLSLEITQGRGERQFRGGVCH
jgi:OPT oligopeptide transporter protein